LLLLPRLGGCASAALSCSLLDQCQCTRFLAFCQLSRQGTVLQHTGPALSEEQLEHLDALSIAVVAGEVAQVEADAGGLTGVRLSDGTACSLMR